MATVGFQDLKVYQLAERLADEVWDIVDKWGVFARDTCGKQLVRAADSVGANIAEGSGRYGFDDIKWFVRYARGSLYETQHWLRRAVRRKLLTPEQIASLKEIVKDLGPMLNAYLSSIGKGVKSKGKGRTGAEPVHTPERKNGNAH
jgi:four helix bundle protein